jgi:hypothetical protein
MKTLGLICLILIIALGTVGVGYAAFNQPLNNTNNLNTGYYAVSWGSYYWYRYEFKFSAYYWWRFARVYRYCQLHYQQYRPNTGKSKQHIADCRDRRNYNQWFRHKCQSVAHYFVWWHFRDDRCSSLFNCNHWYHSGGEHQSSS